MYNNFLIGYLIGKNKSHSLDEVILTPTKETINRHRQVLEFIDKIDSWIVYEFMFLFIRHEEVCNDYKKFCLRV